MITLDILSPTQLAEELLCIQEQDPHIIIAGSLGRAALFNRYLYNPGFEYTRREETPLMGQSKPRDIDVIGNVSLTGLLEVPHEVDIRAYNNDFFSIDYEEPGAWYLRSARYGFEERLDEKVMAPVHGHTVFGIPCRTVGLQTHLNLFGTRGNLRDKDIASRAALMELWDDVRDAGELKEGGIFEPFEELREVIKKDWFVRIQHLYYSAVSEGMRETLSPHIQKAKNWLLHRTDR